MIVQIDLCILIIIIIIIIIIIMLNLPVVVDPDSVVLGELWTVDIMDEIRVFDSEVSS